MAWKQVSAELVDDALLKRQKGPSMKCDACGEPVHYEQDEQGNSVLVTDRNIMDERWKPLRSMCMNNPEGGHQV
jgi:formylmethanofuran dehydrogenase subunit E